MKERETYLMLRKKLLPYPIILQRIEYQCVPDLFFRSENKGGWIEIKDLKKLTGTIRIPFRPGQFAWIQTHVRLNGTSYLFCTMPDDFIYIFKNENIKKLYTENEFNSLANYILDIEYLNGKDMYNILNKQS